CAFPVDLSTLFTVFFMKRLTLRLSSVKKKAGEDRQMDKRFRLWMASGWFLSRSTDAGHRARAFLTAIVFLCCPDSTHPFLEQVQTIDFPLQLADGCRFRHGRPWLVISRKSSHHRLRIGKMEGQQALFFLFEGILLLIYIQQREGIDHLLTVKGKEPAQKHSDIDDWTPHPAVVKIDPTPPAFPHQQIM